MKKKDVILGVRVDAELEKLIKSMARKEDRSVSWIIRDLITKGLKTRKLIKAGKR